MILALTGALTPAYARADESLKVDVLVDEVPRGTYNVLIGPGGEVRMLVDDLKALGVPDVPAFLATPGPGGARYIRLTALFPKVATRLDRGGGVLHLTLRTGASTEPPRRRPGFREYEAAIMALTVNGAEVGERIVYLTRAGAVLMSVDDLKAAGVTRVRPETIRMVEGEPYAVLDDLRPWLLHAVDRQRAALVVTIEPARLAPTVVNLAPRSAPGALRLDAPGVFLNYAVSYVGGEGGRFAALDAPVEVGARVLGGFAFTDLAYSRRDAPAGGTSDRLVRRESYLTFDAEAGPTRLRIGDLTAGGEPLGGTARMAGVSLAREFSLTPYLIRFPGLSVEGTLTTPSEVSVYANGIRVRRDRLPAGNFTYEDLPRTTGAGESELVIRDAFGRETRVTTPFYVSSRLLRRGLSAYSYNVGVARDAFGTRSGDYGNPVLSAFHRAGFTRWLTAGFRVEGDDQVVGGGPDAVLVLGRAGELDLAAGASRSGGRAGGAWEAAYAYVGRRVGLRLGASGRSRDYATLSVPRGADKVKRSGDATLSLSLGSLGSLSLSGTDQEFHLAPHLERVGLFYSRSIGRATALFVRADRTRGDSVDDEVFVGLNRALGGEHSAGADWQAREDIATSRASVHRNAPLGPGWGYRLEGTRTDDTTAGAAERTLTDGDAYVEYHSPWGVYEAEARGGDGSETYRATAAGALAWTGGTLRTARPVRDAFALVRVPGVAGVRVYHDSRLTARTDRDGVALVPDLISFVDNRISIDPRDVPLGYAIGASARTVTLPYRGAGALEFPVARLRAFVGRLLVAERAGRTPAELTWLTVGRDGAERRVPVGRGGEFYLENLAPGDHPARVAWKDAECRFTIRIPEGEEVMTDLGDVVCDAR